MLINNLIKSLIVNNKHHCEAKNNIERIDQSKNILQILLFVHVVIRVIINVSHFIDIFISLKEDQESHDQLLSCHEQKYLQVAYHRHVYQWTKHKEYHILKYFIVDLW